MTTITVKCPTCNLAGHGSICVCCGRGRMTIDGAQFTGEYEIVPLLLCAAEGTPVSYSDPRRAYFEHFTVAPEPDDPRIACWGLYARLREGGAVSIADFSSPDGAQDFRDLLIEAIGGASWRNSP